MKRGQKQDGAEKENYASMKELPVCEQPYEKCQKRGPEFLSEAELVAVIIRTGSCGERSVDLARRVLGILPGQCLSGLFQISLEQLRGIRGIGKVKAVQMKCLAECCKRMSISEADQKELICNNPEPAASYFMNEMRYLETEQVRLLILDGKNAMKHNLIVSNGSFNASYASPREIFYYALKHKAVSVIVMHNHPSGDASPSREDIILTKRLEEAGKLVGVSLLDHIIIGNGRYTSLKESGYF